MMTRWHWLALLAGSAGFCAWCAVTTDTAILDRAPTLAWAWLGASVGVLYLGMHRLVKLALWHREVLTYPVWLWTAASLGAPVLALLVLSALIALDVNVPTPSIE